MNDLIGWNLKTWISYLPSYTIQKVYINKSKRKEKCEYINKKLK